MSVSASFRRLSSAGPVAVLGHYYLGGAKVASGV